jgi:large subunit ribosomal protein L1
MTEKTLVAIKEAKEKTKKRNFSQSFDLIISLKEFDTKKADNKFSEDFILPHGRGDGAGVVVFADSIKNVDCTILTTEDVNNLSKNKRETKKLIAKTDFFLAEPKLMPVIGKSLGQLLAPRGMMPKLISGDAKSMVDNYKKSVKIKVKDAPVIQCLVGKDDMDDKKIEENIDAVLNFVESKLPKKKYNIGKVLLKLTMGTPVRIEV